jgi:hypothetical protein
MVGEAAGHVVNQRETGLLLAFNLPSNIPVFVIVIGSFIAIAVAKMTFGGLGNNPFNLDDRNFISKGKPARPAAHPPNEKEDGKKENQQCKDDSHSYQNLFSFHRSSRILKNIKRIQTGDIRIVSKGAS